MSVERTLFAFGGTMVMLTCPPSGLMQKFGMKTEAELALENQ
jgi:hypothetical protein